MVESEGSIKAALAHLKGPGPYCVDGRLLIPQQHRLKTSNCVEIYDSKIHPEWDGLDGVIIRKVFAKKEEIYCYFVGIVHDGRYQTGYVEMECAIGWKFVHKEFDIKREAFKYETYKLAYQHKTRWCGYCGISKRKCQAGLKGCKGCKDIKFKYRIRYCSEKCQRADWKRHKQICARKGRTPLSKVRAESDLKFVILDP